ncbi:hypothetical protein ACWD0J_40130 [Streptomyces sp. NPDC003011]
MPSTTPGTRPPGHLPAALLGSVILGACYFVLFLLGKGFGSGDVKLASSSGLS